MSQSNARADIIAAELQAAYAAARKLIRDAALARWAVAPVAEDAAEQPKGAR